MTRRRTRWGPHRPVLDADGEQFTFATPGAPTPEERRAYATARLANHTPSALTPTQQAAHEASERQRRELFPLSYL